MSGNDDNDDDDDEDGNDGNDDLGDDDDDDGDDGDNFNNDDDAGHESIVFKSSFCTLAFNQSCHFQVIKKC